MIEPIEFVVYGAPVAQPRVKAQAVMSKGGRMFAHVYEPGRKDSPARQWKSNVKAAAVNEQMKGKFPIWDGPIMMSAIFYLPRPAAYCRNKDPDGAIYHITKPDTDNLIKGVKDALSGILYHDDKQICVERVEKFYHEKGKGPRAVISVRPLEG